MAKLAVLASLLVALLALAEASSYTTITTTVVEDGEPRRTSQRRCSEQVQRQPLRQCSKYLSSRRRSPDEVLEMELERADPQRSQQLQQCCQELTNVDEQCRCEAIRQVVRRQQQEQQEQQEQGEWQGEKMQQVVQKAESLPQKCNMQQPRECRIRAVWF